MGRPGLGGFHDLGGLDPLGPLDRTDKDFHLWERRTHALMLTLVRKDLLSVDELRRGIEGLPEGAHQVMSYYEKWSASMSAIMVERGVLTQSALEAQLGPPEEEPSEAKFAAGALVRVREENAAVRWRKPHLRTPGYIFGLVGTVERDCQGLFGNPEALAFHHEAPKQPLYRVRFSQADVWEGYHGSDQDTVDIEIYQPWLLPATQEELDAQRTQRAARQAIFHAHEEKAHAHDHSHAHDGHTHDHDGHTHEGGHTHAGEHGHDEAHPPHKAHKPHAHAHPHSHGEGEDEHVHEERCKVEQAACDKEGEEDAERRRLPDALVRALMEAGVVTADELRQGVEAMDARGTSGAGARLVARAWVDADFKARLIKDAGAACAELGISASVYPTATPAAAAAAGAAGAAAAAGGGEAAGAAAGGGAAAAGALPVRHGTILTVVENTPKVHNVIVCTLCSCYPLSILGMSPSWYKSRAYRSRTIREPRNVLREFGTIVPDEVSVAVHDSTADNRYLVLPMRPAGTEGWTEEQLQAIVTRDTMVGVTVPVIKPPVPPSTSA